VGKKDGDLTMNKELEELLSRPTNPVPDVGRVAFGLGRNASYEAAARGDIATINFGRLKRVPTSWLRRKLGLDGTAA
jgi:hypothetical protein